MREGYLKRKRDEELFSLWVDPFLSAPAFGDREMRASRTMSNSKSSGSKPVHLVTSSFLLLVVMHVLLVAMPVLLVVMPVFLVAMHLLLHKKGSSVSIVA